MLRNLLIIMCLTCTLIPASAQKKKGKKNKHKTETAASTQATDTMKMDYRAIGAPMPEVRIVTMDNKVYTNKDLDNKANIFVMLFNPTCEHCQEETLILEKNIHKFKKSKIVLMAAPNMGDYMEFFRNTTKYSQYPSLIVGLDSADCINKLYNYSSLPQINVYDKNRQLIKVFNSDTPIGELEEYIQ